MQNKFKNSMKQLLDLAVFEFLPKNIAFLFYISLRYKALHLSVIEQFHLHNISLSILLAESETI